MASPRLRKKLPSRSGMMLSLRGDTTNAPVVLLSCVKSKRDHACKSKDMYISPLFKKMLAYAERLKPKSIFILSAKHGLLSLNDLIEPYEETLGKMSSRERAAWAATVVEKLAQLTDLENDHFVCMAGARYREGLLPRLVHYSVPMAGLPFGKQLQWLDANLA